MKALLGSLLALCVGACGGSTQQANASPSADRVTLAYVALVHNYWMGITTADGVSGSHNEAALVCLGVKDPSSLTDLQLVDPARCHEHATALLAVQQKFLAGLDTTPPPARFAADDRAIRAALPQAIADLNKMISVTSNQDKQSVVDATFAYIHDMVPAVTRALDDVDPTVVHE